VRLSGPVYAARDAAHRRMAAALAVHIETFARLIASLPVAVNLQCHSARLKEAVIYDDCEGGH